MRGKFTVIISFILLLGVVVGCSAKAESFDDGNIIFKVVDSELNNESKAKSVELTNETGFDLDNLFVEISHSSSMGEDNKHNRESVQSIEEFKIKSGETKAISIPDLKENTDAIDLEINLKGYVVEGHEKVPFELGGALSALVSQS